MNKFDRTFFKKYVPDGNEIVGIVHEHFLVILDNLLITLSFGALFPAFLYRESEILNNNIPFLYLEIWLFIVFIKLLYDIFDRYNDVFIITDSGVIDLKWSLFDTNNTSVKHDNIEGIEVEQKGIWDTVLGKGDIVIHKIGSDNFILKDAVSPYKAVDEIEKAGRGGSDDTGFGDGEEDFGDMGENFPMDDDFMGGEDNSFGDEPKSNDYNKEVVEILGEIVKEHLEKKGYTPQEDKEKIEEAKSEAKKRGDTIDLS